MAGRSSDWGGETSPATRMKAVASAGVVGGGGMEPGDVGAHQPDLAGSAALDAGEDQVAAGRHLPRHVDQAGEVAEPAVAAAARCPERGGGAG